MHSGSQVFPKDLRRGRPSARAGSGAGDRPDRGATDHFTYSGSTRGGHWPTPRMPIE